MSWSLINSIKNKTDLRMILPIGLALEIGDVVSVGDDGILTLEGKCSSILGVKPGKAGATGQPVDTMTTSDKGVTISFRAAGSASSISDQVPSAKAGFDIRFAKAESWLLAILGREIKSLEVNKLRAPILDAYNRGVWRPNFAIITSVATVQSMTLIASTSKSAQVALSMGATVANAAALEAKLTADVSVSYTNQQLTQCILKKKTVAFCKALRVSDPWWKKPDVTVLSAVEKKKRGSALTAPDKKFWEDADDIF
jgi:hypothetical protein